MRGPIDPQADPDRAPAHVVVATLAIAVVVGILVGLVIGVAIVHVRDREPPPLQMEVWVDPGPTVWRGGR